MKEIESIYNKIDKLLVSLEKKSKLKMESPLFSEFLYKKFGSLSEHKSEDFDFLELQKMSKRLLEVKENRVPKQLIIPGNIYYFTYIPKGRVKLEYWDKNPCVICLGRFRGGFYGLNLNLLDPVRRYILLRKIPFIANQDKYELFLRMEKNYKLNEYHEFSPHRTYFAYKSAKKYLKEEYKVIFRKYLYTQMPLSSFPGHIPFKYFKIILVLDLFDFYPKQSALGVWTKTRKQISQKNRK